MRALQKVAVFVGADHTVFAGQKRAGSTITISKQQPVG